MNASRILAAAGLALFTTFAAAQLPPGITQEMIATALPEEGAPKAVTGTHAVMNELAFGNENLKVFRPTSLDHFPGHDTLPVVIWGNGGCAMNVGRNAGWLETMASHGFLVISTNPGPTTLTPPAAGQQGPPRPRQATWNDLKAGIDWAEKENARDGSPLKGKINIAKVAVMGQSCGGRMSFELGGDARVQAIGVFNAGLTPEQMKDLLPKQHGPILLINGHERDFQMAASKATFEAIDRLPVFYGARKGAGHTATAYHPGGGEFANVATNWVRWQFKGDKKAGEMFVGEKCGLCTNSNWDVGSKRLK